MWEQREELIRWEESVSELQIKMSKDGPPQQNVSLSSAFFFWFVSVLIKCSGGGPTEPGQLCVTKQVTEPQIEPSAGSWSGSYGSHVQAEASATLK